MPLYAYKVKNEAGKVFSGQAKIKKRDELEKIISAKGLTVLEIWEKNALSDISTIGIFKKKVKTKDLAIFCRQFAIVLSAGVPIGLAMDVMRQQTENPTLQECLTDIYEDIQKGIQLSKSMGNSSVFPDILVNMVEAGEVSGQLDLVFARMAEHFEREYKLNQKIKGAMTYPVIVCVVAVAVIIILLARVVPSFMDILTGFGVDMPATTRILIVVSEFFKSYWWLIVFSIIGIFTGGKMYKRSESGKLFFGELAIKLPVLKGVTENIITSRFSRTMETLINSGVQLIKSLEIVQKVIGNAVIEKRITGVIDEIKKGKGLTGPLSEMKYFSPMIVSMVRIGEESGNLEYTLKKSADFYEEEMQASLQKLTTFIEPLVICVLAVVIGFIVISVLLPMYSIYQNLSF